MSDNDEDVAQFRNLTGVTEERARFYLEAASWDLQAALTNFYDADTDNSDVEIIEPTTRRTNTRFATIPNATISSDEEEEGQAFYVGGSEQSGQQVLGPKKKRDIVEDMFKHGVEVIDIASTSSARAFKGTGYKLGQTESDSETVPGAPEPPKPVQVTLKLWRDGFSVDNGQLRLYNDPANQEFLNSVRKGEIPHELRRGFSEVHVSMEDHRMEEFAQPNEPKSRAVFQGQGHTLGSPTPAVVGAPLQEDRTANESHAQRALHVDASQPVTSLQIRLADGTRLVQQFNHGHTVMDIRHYITTARPQYETRSFSLLSAFPTRPLDDSQTIADAGILNSAIIQKLT